MGNKIQLIILFWLLWCSSTKHLAILKGKGSLALKWGLQLVIQTYFTNHFELLRVICHKNKNQPYTYRTLYFLHLKVKYKVISTVNWLSEPNPSGYGELYSNVNLDVIFLSHSIMLHIQLLYITLDNMHSFLVAVYIYACLIWLGSSQLHCKNV